MKITNTAFLIQELGQRANQEDSLFPKYSPSAISSACYVLCDGMGGHSAGEVASGTVCDKIGKYVINHLKENCCFGEADFKEALDAAYDALDVLDDGAERKMGTTLTSIVFHSDGCFAAHIGDSRIYQIRPSERKVLFVTRDHSLVNDLVALGELTPEEAKTSKQKNVITRAVQPNQERRAYADSVNLTDILPGDYFFLCSDGMLEQMSDTELINILSMKRSDSEKIKILRGATKDNKDNHSAILVHIKSVNQNDSPIANNAIDETSTIPSPRKKTPWLIVCVFIVLLLISFFIIK